MGQVTRNINQIITRAFYLIGEFDNQEVIPGPDMQEGLDILNLLIDHYSGEKIYIPFIQLFEFDLQPNKQVYSFSNVPGVVADFNTNRMTGIEYCNMIRETGVYPIQEITRTELLVNAFVNVPAAWPSYVILDRQVNQTNLYFYPIPNDVYHIELRAKFYLDSFGLDADINNVPLNWQRFLVYALGRELVAYYPSGSWTDKMEETFMTMYYDMLNSNDLDMTLRPSQLMMSRLLRAGGIYSILTGTL